MGLSSFALRHMGWRRRRGSGGQGSGAVRLASVSRGRCPSRLGPRVAAGRVLGDGDAGAAYNVFPLGPFFHVQYIERTQSIITAWLDAHYATAVDK